MNRFYFTKSKDEKLYKLCTEAEMRISDDIDILLLKCGRAANYIAECIGRLPKEACEGVKISENGFKVSRVLEESLRNMQCICSSCLEIGKEKGDRPASAGEILELLNRLCRGYIGVLIEKEVSLKQQEGMELLQQKQKQLSEAFERYDFEAVSKINQEIRELSERQEKAVADLRHIDEYPTNITTEEDTCCVSCSYATFINGDCWCSYAGCYRLGIKCQDWYRADLI